MSICWKLITSTNGVADHFFKITIHISDVASVGVTDHKARSPSRRIVHLAMYLTAKVGERLRVGLWMEVVGLGPKTCSQLF